MANKPFNIVTEIFNSGEENMLILTSDGLSSNNLINETKKYIEERKNKAVTITTASVGYKENDWHIPCLVKELNLLGLDELLYHTTM